MKIHIFSLEPIETRYTASWYTHIPKLFSDAGYKVNQIDGDTSSTTASAGAFLDFTNTNKWKSTQLAKFIDMVNTGEVGDNDHILITDAWNPCVTQLKYIKELSNKNWVIHGIWHAGHYDKQDFLGRVQNGKWLNNLERSMYQCFDHNYFATEFHIDLFVDNVFGPWYDSEVKWMGDEYTKKGWTKLQLKSKKIVRTGLPFEYLEDTIKKDVDIQIAGSKINSIVFPHRLAPEKQLEIFQDLAKELPQYYWVVCQEEPKTKHKYHEILHYSKICFSASLQETLGISQNIEAPAAGCLPMNPNRLSYTEIFKHHKDFLYPSKWTEDWDSYVKNKEKVKNRIVNMIENYDKYLPILEDYKKTAMPKYFSADKMMEVFDEYAKKA